MSPNSKERKALAASRRVVVKLGTSLSFDPVKGIDPTNLKRLAVEIASLRRRGKEIIMVASGAVGAGMNRLKLKQRPARIREKQATASVGQVYLMDLLATVFSQKGLSLGQVLITRQDLESGPRYFNARNTLEQLLQMGVIPVINENDTVAVDELRFGDNDRLAALVTNLVRADLLVILTDVDGLYTADPRRHSKARLVGLVRDIGRKLQAAAGGEGSISGTGGMVTKLLAAKMCMRNGEHCVIASGRKPGVLTRILSGGEEGSFFAAKAMPKERRLRWMPFSERPLAELVLAEAGVRRLKAGKGHLYATDIRKVIGHFYAGDVVRLVNGRHNTFAKGVSRYSSEDCLRRRGQQLHEEVMILDDIAFRGSL